jgi:hypothetical protein
MTKSEVVAGEGLGVRDKFDALLRPLTPALSPDHTV